MFMYHRYIIYSKYEEKGIEQKLLIYHSFIGFEKRNLESLELKKEFMKRFSLFKMTSQDEAIWKDIFNFLKIKTKLL